MLKLLLTYLAICTILASTSSFAETPAPEHSAICEPSKDRTIEPGKSIFGCPIGATEEEVIKKLGKPTGKLTPDEQRIYLLYEKNNFLEFLCGKLIGVSISREISHGQPISEDDGNGMLSNGIKLGMNLAEIKKILGEKFKKHGNFSTFYYEEEGSMISLNFYGKGSADRINFDAFELHDVTVKSNAPFSIDPSRSFFDCEIGSTTEEVISKLGQPLRKYNLHDGMTAFIYGEDCALLFWNDQLGGIDLQGEGSIRGELSKKSGRDYIDSSPKTFFKYDSTPETKYLWQLKNGMRPGIDLQQAKTILGDKFPSKVDKVLRYQDGDTLVTFRVSEQKLGSVYMEPAVIERSDKLTIDPAKSIFGCPLGSTPEEVISKLGEPIGTHNLGHGKSALVYGADSALLFWHGRLRGLALEGNGNLINFGRFLEKSLPDTIHIPRFASYHIGGANYGENVAYFDMSRPHDQKFGFPRYSWRLTNGLHSGMHLEKTKLILGDKFPEKVENTISYEDGDTLVTFQVSDQKLGSVYLEPAISETSNGLAEPNENYLNLDSKHCIFDSKFGSTPEEVISRLGQPNGKYNLSDSKRCFLYGKSCLLIFNSNKLQNIAVGSFFSDSSSLSGTASRPSMETLSSTADHWQLKNGLQKGMDLDLAKEILGNKISQKDLGSVFYTEKDSIFNISLSDIDSNRKALDSIYIESATDGNENHLAIDPAKSIFGCELGSSPDEVIKRLGQPLGKINLKNGQSALIFGKECFLTFSNDKLVGAEISEYALNRISNVIAYLIKMKSNKMNYQSFKKENLSLVNGIKIGMSLAEAKKRLGLKQKVNLHEPLKYTDGPSKISFGLTTNYDDEGTIITSINIAPINVKSK